MPDLVLTEDEQEELFECLDRLDRLSERMGALGPRLERIAETIEEERAKRNA